MWENAYVATLFALGETEETIRATLAKEPDLLDALKSPDKRVRAKTLATAIAAIAFDLERVEVEG